MVLSKIRNNTFMLPAWQREFVWDLRKIESLFDSIFNEYPINNILIWDTKTKYTDIFYRFIRNCEFIGNKPSSTNPSDDRNYNRSIRAVLDGQQRLTSLYLVLDSDSVIERKKKQSF